MSDFADFIDQTLLQIQNEVAGLDSTVVPGDAVHRYAPWDPAELTADGRRHLAMWPVGDEQAESSEYIAQGFDTLRQGFAVLVWEDSQGARMVADQDADRAWLELVDGLRGFFYVEGRRQVSFPWGGYYRVHYEGVQLPDTSARVRWARVLVSADRSIRYV